MKKIIVVQLVLIGALNILSPKATSAHVVENSKDVSAIMHIQPDDDPVAGKITKLQFTFASTNNVFMVSGCECAVILVQDDKEVAHEQLIGTETIGTTQITFPRVGAYQILLHGNARDGSFEPFTLTYTTRVDRNESQTETVSGDGLEVLLFSGLTISLLWAVGLRRIQDSRKYKK